jgi:hypothetical protein
MTGRVSVLVGLREKIIQLNLENLRRFSKWIFVLSERSQEEDMTDLNRRFDENVYDLNIILHPGLRSSSGCLGRHNAFESGKAGDPGIMGFRCRRGDFVPEPAGNTGGKKCRVDRRHPRSAFQSRLLAANATRR